MYIVFIKIIFCKIYGFRNTMSIRIRALSVFAYFPLNNVDIKYIKFKYKFNMNIKT